MQQLPINLKLALALIVLPGVAGMLESFPAGAGNSDLRDPALLTVLVSIVVGVAIIMAVPVVAMVKGHAWGRTMYLTLVLLLPLAYETGVVTPDDLAASTLPERLATFGHLLADIAAVLLLFSASVDRWFDQAAEDRRSAIVKAAAPA